MTTKQFSLLCLLAPFFLLSALQAQTTSKAYDALQNAAPAPELSLAEEEESWSFFHDEESQIYFIDFESITLNVSDVIVKDAGGEIVFSEEVIDLPVDTIYELDYSELGSGTYEVELHSFTKILKREISID